jgi:hypothetical protein
LWPRLRGQKGCDWAKVGEFPGRGGLEDPIMSKVPRLRMSSREARNHALTEDDIGFDGDDVGE